MNRVLQHGESLSLNLVASGGIDLVLAAPLPPGAQVALHDFGFLFPAEASDPSTRLPDGPATRQQLIDLGMALGEAGGTFDAKIPAAYTYLGQFIDHDITFEAASDQISSGIRDVVAALTPARILREIKNTRTGTFDLDSVYEGAPQDPAQSELMLIGRVTDSGARPPGKTDDNDLPRVPVPPASDGPCASADPCEFDEERRCRPGQALIGDPRNDENVIISQLHVAFLKAHNALVTSHGMTFAAARTALRQHYQWMVLHDFLPQICDGRTLQAVMSDGPTLFAGTREFMPLEFSVCAYRFGHSMVRDCYDINSIHPEATLAQLFQFTELTGAVGKPSGPPTLPSDAIVDWDRLTDRSGAGQRARALDTALAPGLLNIPLREADPALNNLAVRNLLRGLLLSMPTGQAVAAALGTPVVTPAQIVGNAKSRREATVLEESGFDSRTPLWYYVLAEGSVLGEGNHLGPVGSRIVAETFIRLLEASADSILASPEWTPTLPSSAANTFTLADLLTLAGV